ncbi:hypothetical protein [Zavarzinella formosa]|uniref:hypothetical protein n=1 Tax=Zavarzinella formosa TaxID=360055 RepID=UPI0002F24822|nr:hypothetical protein [Zavarzinella formosa]
MTTKITPDTYRSYRNLPPLAGLCTLAQAAKPGLSIEACTTRLKEIHYALKRLQEILTARITSEPIYELKTGFAHHAHLCAEHADALRTRVGEMREPPLGLEAVPHPAWEIFFDEILAARTTEELLVGLYDHAMPELHSLMFHYSEDTNPLTDAPSRRVLRFAMLEVEDMIDFGEASVDALVTPDFRTGFHEWEELLQNCLKAVDGKIPVESLERQYSATPYVYDPLPKRDERWKDQWNQGVNAEAFLYDENMPAKAKALMMLFKRIREVDVPEMMSSILTQTKGKPSKYYRDMTRQMWDEARHAMMGEVGFVALGVDWTAARITFNWSMRLNTECTPMERHAVLYFIEQGLMPRTGKRYEWEVAQESGIPLMATIQDFDWADEVLHAAIGRQWYIPEFGHINKALEYGDKCWSKITSNWQEVREKGLTSHENWWPALYSQACKAWGATADAKALAFATTYDGKRADLKEIHAD